MTRTRMGALARRCAAATAVAAALAAGAGCARHEQRGGGFQMPPLPVETARIEPRPLAQSYTAVGTLEAAEQIDVAAEIDGLVALLPFREGGELRRGDLIAQLDDAQLRAEVDRAEALVEQARASHARVAAVVAQQAGAPQDLDDAAAALKVAEANLALARARLAKTRLTAPFDGVAGTRRVSAGAYLRAGQAVTDLARLDELRLRFTLPERLLGSIRRGAMVTITSSAFPDLALTGEVEVVEPVVDAATRSARVVARLGNPDRRLRPGMSAAVEVVLAERPAALAVPSEAVFAQGDQMLVYVVGADSTIAATPVTLGLRLPEAVEVTAGLSAGDVVVRAGHQKLFPGARVAPLGDAP